MKEKIRLRWVRFNIVDEIETSRKEINRIINRELEDEILLVYVNFDRNDRENTTRIWLEAAHKEKTMILKKSEYKMLKQYCKS